MSLVGQIPGKNVHVLVALSPTEFKMASAVAEKTGDAVPLVMRKALLFLLQTVNARAHEVARNAEEAYKAAEKNDEGK